MLPKRSLLVAACVSLLFSLTACFPGQSTEDNRAEFYASWAGRDGVPGYLLTGSGWKPNSKVEISIWNEPDGPGSANTQWKKILDANVNAFSQFGSNSSAPFYPVRRGICGFPENGQKMVFMVKSVATGTIRQREVPADLYFTFTKCP